MNVVFMGTPDFSVPTLSLLLEHHNVQGIFTQPDKPRGRGHKIQFPPIKDLALSHNIPVFQPSSLKKGDDAVAAINTLKKLSPDVIVVVAYGKILPLELLSIPRFGCVNVHASLLPKFRGAGPIQWSILNGETETGVTTMLMAEGLDTGDMLLKSSVKIGLDETASELHDRLAKIGGELLIKTLAELQNGTVLPSKQDDALSSYAPMLTRELSPIDFTKTAAEIHNRIRGLSSWPCATALLNGKKLKFYKSTLPQIDCTGKIPGEILDNSNFTICCGDNKAIQILEVQAEGSKKMMSADYLRGNPILVGTILSKS